MPKIVRLLSKKHHWDAEENRFKSAAFQAPNISIFFCRCACEESSCVCNHARKFYSTISDPPVYWKLDAESLPKSCTLDKADGDNDICHREINGFTRRESKKFFKDSFPKEISELFFCDPINSVRSLNLEDMD
jgi:hypothetical protein